MIVELPEWQPYAAGEYPWTPEAGDRGRVVVALAPAPASREQWSAEIVFDLLEGWSRSGHRVVLADYVLEHPMLHRRAGLTNEEGLADAALFGASVSRIARPVPGRSFFFVGAGSPAGDPEAVLSTDRLGRLQDGFREAGVTFVAFVRRGCVGTSELVEAADDVLVLAHGAEDLPDGVHGSSSKVRAVLGPQDGQPGLIGPGHAEVVPTEPALPGGTDVHAGLELAEPLAGHVEAAGPESGDASGTGIEDPTSGAADGFEWADSWQEDIAHAEDTLEGDGDGASAPPEAEMDFSTPSDDEVAAADAGESDADVHVRESDSGATPVAPVRSRRSHRGADPDARRKLLWVLLAVLVLVVLVVLGALG